MTRKETVRNLLTELIDMIDNGSQRDLDRADEIGVSIIKLLEQEPVLDKIRAEIEQTTSRYSISRERGGMGQIEWSDRLIKESKVLQILDKYDTAKIKNDMADIGKELRTRFDKYKAESEEA